MGAIIPVFAVRASEGIICPGFIAEEEPRAAGTLCPCYLGDRLHKYKHMHALVCKVISMQKCWHRRTMGMKNMHVHMNHPTALMVTRPICTLVVLQISQNANVWIYVSSIPP